MIVLDTHVLLWLASDEQRLSEIASGTVELEGDLAISTVSIQEIAYLNTRKRITLDRPIARWIGDSLRAHQIEPLAPTVEVAIRAGTLDPDEFPGDPADRMIYATAVDQGARLITADRRLRAFDPARAVW